MSLRVNQAEQEDTAIVDVDGSYLYRKYKSFTEAGEQVLLPGHPPPLAGRKSVTEETYQTIAPSIPPVTSGNFFLKSSTYTEYSCDDFVIQV